MKFNFDGKAYNELCNIGSSRAEEIAAVYGKICSEIVNNESEYTFTEGSAHGLSKGKVLQRFFETITDEQEQYLLMFAFDELMDKMCVAIERKRLSERLRVGLNEALDELFGNKKYQA